jgi:hypothetical protein
MATIETDRFQERPTKRKTATGGLSFGLSRAILEDLRQAFAQCLEIRQEGKPPFERCQGLCLGFNWAIAVRARKS